MHTCSNKGHWPKCCMVCSSVPHSQFSFRSSFKYPHLWKSTLQRPMPHVSLLKHFRSIHICSAPAGNSSQGLSAIGETGDKSESLFFNIVCFDTQQNYYGRRCGALLHSYCTGTYTEVTVLLLWSNSAVTMEYPHSYSVGVPAWVLQGNIGATSKKQHCYFSVGTSAVTV